MKKNMLIYPVSALLAAGLFAGCAAMSVQAAPGKTTPGRTAPASSAKPEASPEPEAPAASRGGRAVLQEQRRLRGGCG